MWPIRPVQVNPKGLLIVLRSALLTAALLAAVTLTGCGRTTTPADPGMGSMSMSGDPMPAGNGTRSSWAGYTLVPAPTNTATNTATSFAFHITGPDGNTITTFEPDQTKLMHLYLIRTDLSGYQHLHPTMAPNGTWTAELTTPAPGSYRAYAAFTTPDAMGKPIASVLSVPFTVPGPVTPVPLPPVAATASVDGYTLTLAGRASRLTLHIAKDGRPVTDLQPYLDSYAHLSAFHAGDLAFAHLHPSGAVDGDHGGPDLSFDAEFSSSGTWRVYVQFQTANVLHTAAFTVQRGR